MSFLYFFWSIPVFEFILYPENLGKSYLILIPTTYVFYYILKKKYEVLIFSLPFYLLLSNLGRSFFGLNFAEIISVFVLFIFIIYLIKIKKYSSTFMQIPILGMAIIFVFSFIISFEYANLYKGFINGINLFAIYGLTRIIINDQNIIKYFEALIIATFYTSLIIIFSYYSEINLNSFDRTLSQNIFNQQLFQATFFYANISFVIAPMVILCVAFFTLSKEKIRKILFFCLIIVILFTVSKTFNKTALVSLFIVGIFFCLKLIFQQRLKIKNLIYLFVTLLVFYFLLNLFFLQEQESNRAIDLTSFKVRLYVAQSTILSLLDNPSILIFGVGPEALFRLGSNEAIINAKTHLYTTEGAIDSAYLSYLFEYGFIFFLLYLTYVFLLIVNLLFIKNKNLELSTDLKHLSYYVGLMCVCIGLISITTVLGVGKISSIVFQIFACSEVLINEKKFKRRI